MHIHMYNVHVYPEISREIRKNQEKSGKKSGEIQRNPEISRDIHSSNMDRTVHIGAVI